MNSSASVAPTDASGGAGSTGVSDDGTRIGDDPGALLGAWGPCSAS
jgi:hypothetical protein